MALLILSDHPHGGEEIQHLLSGQILFVSLEDVMMHAPIYGIILALWFFLPNKARQGNLFYLLFAIAITSSVQLVGVYVVFASLILPAIAASPYKQKQAVAWACGIVSVMLGILASIITDAPAGNMIVITYAMTALVIRIVKINKSLK